MAQVDKFSPNVTLNNNILMTTSPNMSNKSESFKFLKPLKNAPKNVRNFSPFDSSVVKSPNLSPIFNTKESPSPFLKRREPSEHSTRRNKGSGCNISINVENSLEQSALNLDNTLNVKMVLKELNLVYLWQIFEREEINLPVFFTLTEDDLKTIGINREDSEKILFFINDFNTPKKPQRIPCKNMLLRH